MEISHPLRAAGDPWLFVADDETLPPAGDLILSYARWLREREALAARPGGRLGVRLDGGDEVAALAGDVQRLALIALTFAPAGDGRGYSQARLLRERFAFAGELRAGGDLLIDHLPFLERCGFDHAVLSQAADPAACRQALHAYSVRYQPAGDPGRPAPREARRGAPRSAPTVRPASRDS
jgi:uncharacterized protein (DUF934 family)